MTHRAKFLCLALLGIGAFYQPTVLSHGTGATGVNLLDWHTETISRVVAPESTWNNFGIGTVFSPPGKVIEIEGTSCLNGSQFDFDVSDVFAFDIDETVELEIDFDLRRSHDTVALAYDQNGGGAEIRLIDLPQDQRERLHTERVSLERARFAGRGDYGTDFQILSVGGGLGAALTICDIRVRRTMQTPLAEALGWLELTVEDEEGRPTPARVGLYDNSGKAPMPSQAAVQMTEFSDLIRVVWLPPTVVNWPAGNRYAFYTDGHYAAAVPAGEYEIVVTKGIEYRTVRRKISIEPHSRQSATITMDRWINMPERGLYSGDVHIHYPRRNAAENQSIWQQAQAEDLHVANTLYMDNIATAHYPQLDWGDDPGFGSGIHRVIPGQEGPRSTVRGHTIHLHIREPVKKPDRYLLYNEIFEAVSAQGGISGFAHGSLEGLRTRAGIALEAPDGLVRFMEVLQFGNLGTDLWFEFLNLGYKISPAAGSDYPYGGHIGDERNYVRIDGQFSPSGWFDGLSAGRTFVTNGPILDFQVNGATMGDQISVSRGDRIVVSAHSSINTDIDLLAKLELIEQGEIIASVESAAGAEVLELEHEFDASAGTWLVLRAYGKSAMQSRPGSYPPALDSVLPTTGYAAAVSAPVYVSVDGQKTWKRDAVAELASEMKDELDNLASLSLDSVGGFEEIWQTDLAWRTAWEFQHALLVERIVQVKAQYDSLIQSARVE